MSLHNQEPTAHRSIIEKYCTIYDSCDDSIFLEQVLLLVSAEDL